MKIETKFNVGDEIWVPAITGTEWEPMASGLSIEDIEIEVDDLGVSIWYHVEEFGGSLQEEACFATRQEANDDCDKRNKEQA